MPALELAIDTVNADSAMLPDTTLVSRFETVADVGKHGMRVHSTDDQCDSAQGIDTVQQQLRADPDIVAIIGSGCSGVCMSATKIGAALEIPTMSWGCSMLELSDKKLFPWFFRLSETERASVDYYLAELVARGYKLIAVISDDSDYNLSIAGAIISGAAEVGTHFHTIVLYVP